MLYKISLLETKKYNNKKFSYPAFFRACERNNAGLVRAMLKSGLIDVNYDDGKALELACDRESVDVVKILLDYKKTNIHLGNEGALQRACARENIIIVKLLLDKGADIHVNDNFCIEYAKHTKNMELYDLLKTYSSK